MSVRLYTICAMCVTASAVAGVLVGGIIAANGREANPAQPVPVSQHSPSLEAAGGMGVPRP
ncbi:hypothetical protein [Saccharopolyspora taberi]|uniref:Uncharacterized protein n=1 Tax=Saccharopolyspora taberi TaxID=60895 RepID=A0ABN3VJ99_9PSEU